MLAVFVDDGVVLVDLATELRLKVEGLRLLIRLRRRNLVKVLLGLAYGLYVAFLDLLLQIDGVGGVDEDHLLPLIQLRLLAIIGLPDAEPRAVLLVELVQGVLRVLVHG